MKFVWKPQITPVRLATVALILWLSSLPFAGFSLYSQDQHIGGLYILLLGWLAALFGNFAWYANVFFFIALFRLFRGKSATIASTLALLLSIDTFRMSEMALNEGGATSPIYGYGWGFILWEIALGILLMAAGMRLPRPVRLPMTQNEINLPLAGGLVFCALVLGFTGFWSVHDHLLANETEHMHISNLAFKRGPICQDNIQIVAVPIEKMIGPLQVVLAKELTHAKYPFNNAKRLLSWGVPVVRFGQLDYRLKDGQFIAVPAQGAPSAVLSVYEDDEPSSSWRNIHAKLIESASKRVVFDQTWRRQHYDVNTYIYCPDYRSFPGPDNQPRNLLMDALNITGAPSIPGKENRAWKDIPQFEGTVINEQDGGETKREKLDRLREKYPDRLTFPEMFNTDCPNGVGWSVERLDTVPNTGRPFLIDEVRYFLRKPTYNNALCAGRVVYLYSTTLPRHKEGYYLKIEKRSLDDFRLLWTRRVVIEKPPISAQPDALTLISVSEIDAVMLLQAINGLNGQILTVEVPLYQSTTGKFEG